MYRVTSSENKYTGLAFSILSNPLLLLALNHSERAANYLITEWNVEEDLVKIIRFFEDDFHDIYTTAFYTSASPIVL